MDIYKCTFSDICERMFVKTKKIIVGFGEIGYLIIIRFDYNFKIYNSILEHGVYFITILLKIIP